MTFGCLASMGKFSTGPNTEGTKQSHARSFLFRQKATEYREKYERILNNLLAFLFCYQSLAMARPKNFPFPSEYLIPQLQDK